MTNTRLYRIWSGMKRRCYNKRSSYYERYGGRGITVCDEWLHDFQAFYDWSMSNGYADDLTIDRIDNDGPYAPWNCRWTTKEEQQNNTSRNLIYKHSGESHTLKQWSEILGINYQTLHSRIVDMGWDLDRAFQKNGGEIVE